MRVDTNVALQHVASDTNKIREVLAYNSKELQCTQDRLGKELHQLSSYIDSRIQEAAHALQEGL